MLNWLLALLVAYAALLILLRVFEPRLIFFPNFPGRLAGEWSPRNLPGKEDAWLITADGLKLHAWWIPAPNAEFTFIALHGNAANIANRAETYQFLHELPASVLAVEYRGYGKSEGAPSEQGIYLDAQAAHDFLTREKGTRAEAIVAFGQSLGTAAATDLAAARPVGAVILEAPFPSAADVARRAYPFLPGITLIMRTRFATAEKLQRVSAPVLVVHCANDPVMPFDFGEAVFRAAREPKTFFRVEGYCHEEASLVAPQGYREALLRFLAGAAGRWEERGKN